MHEEEALLRPEIGTQTQFKKKKPPKTYRYDSSLSPALDWDGQNHAREFGEWLLAQIEDASALEPPHRFSDARRFGDVVVEGLDDAIRELKAISEPFLNWAGKAERLSFEVPTLPLFLEERLSTKAILETLSGHERDRQMELNLFGDPQLSLAQQLEAYEHLGGWVNRLILGDSLIVMNSLLEYEGLGEEVQTIFIDPPYGVKFGSNFQPFVRKRSVKDATDEDLTREPEMVRAYRDTWELGVHSYLTYLRDRVTVSRDLLAKSGSIFLQIGDENVHRVRALMDEVFGEDNFVSVITFKKTSSTSGDQLAGVTDYLLWYAKEKSSMKFRSLYHPKQIGGAGADQYRWVETKDGDRRRATKDELQEFPPGLRFFRPDNLVSQRPAREGDLKSFEFEGRTYTPGTGTFKTDERGMKALAAAQRLIRTGKTLSYVRYLDDFPAFPYSNLWDDTATGGFTDPKVYVVQTNTKVVQRCVLMTSDPGDLVLDPTCGSGTTAYVAEQWGRRWITIDASRVPLALTRQRLLTATFPFYELKNSERGPAGGFVFKRRQNKKGEEVGGIVPHVTLKSVANNEPAPEEVLVDRPEVEKSVTRVTGPFAVEATIPTSLNGTEQVEDHEDGEGSSARLLEALRRDPILHLPSGAIELKNVQLPAKSLTLSAEAVLASDQTPVAFLFGPESGAVSAKTVFEAAKEAYARSYARLIVIGFAIEPDARELVDKAEDLVGVPATYVAATPDLIMGDLLKTMRSSQLFSVTGLPDVAVTSVPPETKGDPPRYQVELRGLDVFDPTTMEATHRQGSDVPAWLLDTDYNDLCFHVSQAFFPRTTAWDALKRGLRGEFEDTVWDHLAGTTSAPFTAAENRKVAVKVIDDRGNELMVVRSLD